ncbi:MAG TPA: protoporphyrinogen oxidase [Pyrinomonadaceae bacterium]|nr:protoporphyrinogen oxidase [Pyrinomonadaceae bacterium]
MKRIIIIGGGITGLATANRLMELSQRSALKFEVTLLESSSKLGGIIKTTHRDDFLLEHGPDSFISEKPAALELIKRLGIESQLLETNKDHRRSFIVRNGKLRPVPRGFQLIGPSLLWPFITSDIFSWPGKIRMALDLVLPRRSSSENYDESLAQFVRRRLGREALERMAQPMVAGIYTADPERLSIRAAMPRFLEMEQAHRSLILGMLKRSGADTVQTNGTSGARYSLFLSFERGMQTLVDELSLRLPKSSVRLNSKVSALRHVAPTGGWTADVDSGASLHADAVCVTVPTYIAASLLRETTGTLSEDLASIAYASTATVNLAYKRADIPHSLDGFGFVIPFIEKRSLIACTFSSIKFARRAPDGYVLLRAFVGGALQPEMFALDETDMLRRVQLDLRELLGVEKSPIFSEVARWPRSMPQYEIGHLERLRRIDDNLAQLPTLKLAGNAYRGAGIPDCIKSGENAAEAMVSFFETAKEGFSR